MIIKYIIAILLFSAIILFHELGHFLLAKANGIRVNEFSLGLGPTIVGFTKGETKYSVKLLPFGGACMMEGEDSQSDDDRSFQKKSVWARISVVAAGPVFNFIMAFVLAVIILGNIGISTPTVAQVEDGYGAQTAGLQAGDEIIKMNHKHIHFFKEISMYTLFHEGETVEVTYERNGEQNTVEVQPSYDEEQGRYRYGIYGSGEYTKVGPIKTLQYSVYEVKYWICSTVDSLKMLVMRKIGMDQLSGPVGIVNVVADAYQQTKSYGAIVVIEQFLYIGILLSANLGVMNLLPLPALDGGRLVFLFVEAIRRKRIPPEKEGYVHGLGFVLLMLLMVFVLFNDVKRIFF